MREELELRGARLGEFELGEWRVRPGCNRIAHRRLGVERRLEPRLMHLLGLLAANTGETLGREWLNSELWPRVIVTENSLTRAVSALRRLLRADGCDGGVRIETVPKKGYRLVIVAKAGESAEPSFGFGAPPWRVVAVPGLALAVFAGGWLAGGSENPETYLAPAGVADFGQLVPVSSVGPAGIRQEAPVLSADGGRYAYIRHDGAGSTVWLGELRGGGEAVAVYSSSLPLTHLVWSPAGNALLFARQGAMATEAVYGAGPAQLMQFDLDSWTISSLRPEAVEAEPRLPAEIDLT